MIGDYIKTHTSDGMYLSSSGRKYSNILGWDDFLLLSHAVISYRRTSYTHRNFAEHLHTHDFYELVIYRFGDVEYTNGDLVFTPHNGETAIIVNKPGQTHTTRLLNEGEYERYVLYFDKAFLSFFGNELPFLSFLDSLESFALPCNDSLSESAISMLNSIIDELSSSSYLAEQNAYASTLLLFSLIASEVYREAETTLIPENILAIKTYVEAHCKELKT